MDNLTHTLVGLMLARCGLEKTTVRGAGMMMLAANMPDLDAVSWLGGSTTYLEYHRGFMHSLTFMPVMALLPILMVRAKFTWRVWLASMVGVLSHLALDWTNSFGIPLLLPFSPRRWRLDIANVVDIWIWVILLTALAATALVMLVNKEMTGRPNANKDANKKSGTRFGWAVFAVLALLSFEALRFTSHQKALGIMKSSLYNNAPPHRVTALPGAYNPFHWRGVIEGDAFVQITSVDVPLFTDRNTYDPSAGRTYFVAQHIPEMDAAMNSAGRTRPFQVFLRWSQLPFWQVMPAADGTAVSLIDLRFGDPGSNGFGGVHALVNRDGTVSAE